MTTDIQEQAAAPDENKIIAERRVKLAALREQGIAFPNDFRPEHKAADLHAQYGSKTREELEAEAAEQTERIRVRITDQVEFEG